MAQKSNQEEFVRKAKDKYGDKYYYDEVVYVRSTEKVRIGCRDHGVWEVTPSNFLNNKGCPKCGREKLGNLFKHNEDKFIAKAIEAHGEGTYDYSLVEYINNKTHVKIKCHTHGVWEQLPSNHYKFGCPTCAAEKRGFSQRTSQEQFIKELREQHGDRYDYSLVEYRGLSRKIDIICNDHGKFSMSASVHKGSGIRGGAGCPKCAKFGYNKAKPGLLYVLTESGGLTKVGITNRDVIHRVGNVSKSSRKSFTALHTYYFVDGSIPDMIETILLREMRKQYNQPTEKFDGYKECFYDVNQAALLNRIEHLISEQHSSQTQAS